MPDETLRQSPTDIPYLSQKDVTLAQVMTEIRELRNEVRELREEVERLSVAVTGNGDPMKGMLVRMTLMERWRSMADKRAFFNIGGAIINFLIAFAVAVYLFLQNNSK